MQPDCLLRETGVFVQRHTSVQCARLGSVISIFAQVNGPVAQRTVTMKAAAKEEQEMERARKA
jgi:hypothetical protein